MESIAKQPIDLYVGRDEVYDGLKVNWQRI